MFGKCLLLNASFEPLTVVSLQRAMILIIDERAEIVEADEGNPIRSAHKEWARPKVLRLKVFVKIPFGAKVALNKKNLYARDGGRCSYCQKQVGISAATIDHVVPRSRGGGNNWENTALACGRCNWEKGDSTLEELGWTLHVTPHVPARQGKNILLAIAEPEWEPYIAAFA